MLNYDIKIGYFKIICYGRKEYGLYFVCFVNILFIDIFVVVVICWLFFFCNCYFV